MGGCEGLPCVQRCGPPDSLLGPTDRHEIAKRRVGTFHGTGSTLLGIANGLRFARRVPQWAQLWAFGRQCGPVFGTMRPKTKGRPQLKTQGPD